MQLLVTLLALGAIVALHEFGHLIVARLCRMRVDRYSIGFGPVLLSFKAGATEYVLSMLPFGGYVKIAGMNPQDGTTPDDPSSYANRPAWQRFLVLAAGPFTNYVLAFFVLAALNFFGRAQPFPVPTIGEVRPSSPAALSGIKPDDIFVSIGGKPVASFDDVRAQIQASQGHAVEIVVKRAGQSVTAATTPVQLDGAWAIGVLPKTMLVRHPLPESIATAAKDTALYNVAILLHIAEWVRGKVSLGLGGPVRAVGETMQAAELGAAAFFEFVGFLSVGVGLFNLFPVPALDGGRLLFVVVEMVRRRPVNQRLETAVHALGFMLLLGLIVFLTWGDVHHWMEGLGRFAPAPDAGH
ncbi:MAG: site-2 protease family protein [Deltaproteobacteria bacterium]|nr:site-2 protease family protein [Deltaproteobacteria bacterium]